MNKNNVVGEGLNVEAGWIGQGRVMGEKWGQLNLNNNKTIFKKLKKLKNK